MTQLQHNKLQKRMNNNNSNQRKNKPAVQITVYVVKQSMIIRRPPKELHNFLSTTTLQTHHHLHSPLKSPGAAASPFDRKAQLLLYSQQLRATATFLKHQPHHKSKQLLHITQNKLVQLSGAGHGLQITTTRNTHHNIDHPTFDPWKVVGVDKQKSGEGEGKLPRPPPSCFGDWKKLFVPSFCTKDHVGHLKRRRRRKKLMIVSLGRKISAIMMSSRMEKERIGVIAKFLSVIGKHR